MLRVKQELLVLFGKRVKYIDKFRVKYSGKISGLTTAHIERVHNLKTNKRKNVIRKKKKAGKSN